MSGGVVLAVGGFTVAAIIEQFAGVPELASANELHLRRRGATIPPDLLARVTVLIEEIDSDGATLADADRALLTPGCATITVPACRLPTLWPLMLQDPRTLPDGSRIPAALGDRLALAMVQNEGDPSRRRAHYQDADVPAMLNLAALFERDAADCFAREAGCDIRVAAYVLSEFPRTRLFHTHERPTSRLAFFVLAQVLALPPIRALSPLPYRELLRRARDWSEETSFGAEEQAPVHPRVATFFGVGWTAPNLRYATPAGWRTFDEWVDYLLTDLTALPSDPGPAPHTPELAIDRYRRATPPPWTDMLGQGDFVTVLARHRPERLVAELAPSTPVSRVPCFAAIDGSGVLSQHGGFFGDPERLHYDAPAALVASLAGGIQLGTSGLVLFDDRIVGDTFRTLPSGPASPMVADILPDRVVLRPGQPARIRLVPGQVMCGFGPLWHDLAHWLLATLPRLVAYAQLRRRFPELRVVLPEIPPTSVYSETLALLSIEADDIVTIAPDEALICQDLLTTGAFDLWSVSPFCLQAARTLARNLPWPRGDSATFRRIYLRPRASPGRLGNFDDIAPVLERHGFAGVFIEDLTLRQRIAIMRQAQMVIAEHGSVMSHMLFAGAGAMVLEIFPPGAVQPLFWSVASVAGLQYGMLVGDPGADDRFTLRPEVLDNVIETMIRRQAENPA
jgi:hypothetical protein